MIKLLNKAYSENNNTINFKHLDDCYENLKSRKDLGFLDLPFRDQLWTESEKTALEIKEKHDHVVIIGFGGSSMSARSIVEITHTKNISFFDNVDMIENTWILNNIHDLKKTAWIFISKSGNTIEVLTLLDFLSEFLKSKEIDLFKNSFFITETKNTAHDNPLFSLAKKHQRPCLEIPVDVGGRFSVFSPAGMLIAGLCGLNLNDIKTGAKSALNDKTLVLDLSYQYLSSFEDKRNISLFWFYNSSMQWFGRWLQQLWAESLGKKLNRSGKPAHPFSTPIMAIGCSEQHSILQQVIDGEKNKFITFFKFENIENFNFQIKNNLFKETEVLKNKNLGLLIKSQVSGTAEALGENNIQNISLTLTNTDSKIVGSLFMLFQLIIALIAEYHDVNAFDQPAVQLGKNKTISKLN